MEHHCFSLDCVSSKSDFGHFGFMSKVKAILAFFVHKNEKKYDVVYFSSQHFRNGSLQLMFGASKWCAEVDMWWKVKRACSIQPVQMHNLFPHDKLVLPYNRLKTPTRVLGYYQNSQQVYPPFSAIINNLTHARTHTHTHTTSHAQTDTHKHIHRTDNSKWGSYFSSIWDSYG